MPIVSCPQCRNPLEIPNELLGGPVRCADCMNVFTPAAGSPPLVTVARPPKMTLEDEHLVENQGQSRSRAWLWVFLLGCTLMSFACCGSCAGLYGIAVKPIMVPYTSPDQQFTASFPGKPSELFMNRKDTAGIEFVRELPAEEHYFIEYTELTPAQKKQDPLKVANDALDAWISSLGVGTFAHRSKVDHKGLPAMKDFGQLDLFVGRLKGFVVLRAVRDGDRVYVIGVSGSVTESERRVIQFFDDFTPRGARGLNGKDQAKGEPAKDAAPQNEDEKKKPQSDEDKKNPFKDD
ncbi:MAG: hypothetical protein U0798_01700 [Gemmataceae bacterium]